MRHDKREIDHLAIAIAGTRRNPKSLMVDRVSTAESLSALRDIYGSARKVGAKVGICTEMVREFLCLLRLSPDARKYWKRGKIASVDIGYRISARVPADGQARMARQVIEHNLTTKDVDAITSYLRDHPLLSVEEAASRVLRSKNKVVYVAEYSIKPSLAHECRRAGLPDDRLWRGVETALEHLAGRKNVLESRCHGKALRIKVNRIGLQRLRAAARKAGVTLRALATEMARNVLESYRRGTRSG